MKQEQQQIHEFMVKAQQVTPDRPTMPTMDVRIGRLKWLAEELCELANAFNVEIELNNRGGTTGNFYGVPMERPVFSEGTKLPLVEAYDAVLDMMVFAVGTGVAMGLELEPGWEEVHRSNMSKFIDGHRRDDGKWIKGPSYSPAKLEPIVDDQILAAVIRDKQLTLST